MMEVFLFIFSISITSITTLPSSLGGCTGQGQTCQFPFLYNGQLHFECSTRAPGGGQDLYGRCPTKLINLATREASNEPSDWAKCDINCPLQEYTKNKEIEEHFISLVQEFPNLASVVNVGQSHLGQNIVGIQITKGVTSEREMMKPKVRYSGNMHGNEPVGREMLNHFAEVLLRGYGVIETITNLVDSTDITLIPTINPDGFDRAREGACSGADYKTGRYNEGNTDLNRNFPTWREINNTLDYIYQDRQPETKAMMALILSEPWVLSANFHDGAVVASYPYDDYRDNQRQTGIHKTPDHEFFKHLASIYATNHETMMNQTVCTRWWFENGITNGADWYPLNGGQQDFNYLFSNDMEITLELSCCKYPRRYYLNREWERNKESLIKYLQQVHRGVKGVVFDGSQDVGRVETDTASPAVTVAGALIVVQELGGPIAKNITSSSRGEFWRLLLPGQYKITAYKDLCSTGGIVLHSETVEVIVSEENPLVIENLVLDRVGPCGNGPR